MPVKVKICGITNFEDAIVAADAGADALGFIFYEPSPRCVTIETAAAIIRRLPPAILKVGVFVNASEDLVSRTAKDCGLNFLQFHGSESPGFCLSFGIESMKAFQIRDASSLTPLAEYKTRAWLLDAWSPSRPGGIGEIFNWDLAVQAGQLGRPIFLAGGLTPKNVGEAISKVNPYGVDVSSGVEASPGRKDHTKLKDFIQAAKSAKTA